MAGRGKTTPRNATTKPVEEAKVEQAEDVATKDVSAEAQSEADNSVYVVYRKKQNGDLRFVKFCNKKEAEVLVNKETKSVKTEEKWQ